MEINRDTPVEKILKSQEVNDTISNMLNPIRQTISDRDSMFTTTMQSGGGLDEGQLIDGEPVLFNSAQEVKNKYNVLSESLNTYESNVSKVSIDKEKTELMELKTCLEKDLEMRISEIERLTKEYYDALDKANEEGIDSPAEIKEIYWNPVHGLIPIQEKEKKYDEETLIVVNNRLSALGMAVTESAALATTTQTKTNYTINTSGTADDIYKSACALRDEIGVELEYLDERIAELNYNLNTLEQWHNTTTKDGKPMIDDETYNRLKTEYETAKTQAESERDKRQHYYDELYNATRNRIGTHDGDLKDARDFGKNDVETARSIAEELNHRAATLTPLSELATVDNGDGTTRVASPMYPARVSSVDEAYQDNISSIAADSSRPMTPISNTTMEAAHSVASSSGTVTTIGDIEIFSTSEYVMNPPNSNGPQIGTHYLVSEYDALQANEAVGVTSPYGDTVYDKSEGRYYSLAEYIATHPEFSLALVE